MELLGSLSIENWINVVGILVGAALSISIYLLQQRLSDKQKIEHRLQLEREIGEKLSDIRYKKTNSKVQFYNTKLIDWGRFAENKRSFVWGYPYHAAELYSANFDGLEFVNGIEEWGDNKYYRVGVIDYERILSVRADGDGSFNGMILYVKPKLLQLDKYSIAYKTFRYYPITGQVFGSTRKPMKYRLRDNLISCNRKLRYAFWLKWKMSWEHRS